MRAISRFGAVGLGLFLVACVTINIYFPTSQAEDAAREIVGDILGKPADGQPPAKPADDKSGSLDWGRGVERIAGGLLDFVIPAANAAQPDFNVETAKIRQIRASMKQRHGRLADYYQNGSIGFTQKALVALRDPGALSLKEKAQVNKLISAENRDRNTLYQAIADANSHPEWEGQVRSVFAKTWIQEAGRGWWYQDPKGRWKQK